MHCRSLRFTVIRGEYPRELTAEIRFWALINISPIQRVGFRGCNLNTWVKTHSYHVSRCYMQTSVPVQVYPRFSDLL